MPIGDSLEQWAFLAKEARKGNEITVNCREANKSVFEFQRDYCQYTDKLMIAVDDEQLGGEVGDDPEVANYAVWNRDEGGSPSYPLRRAVEYPFVPHKYICLQPDAGRHNKRRKPLMECLAIGPGLSVGTSGEWVMPGTKPYHDRSLVDVAKALYHSEGVVGVLSSISLFGALLGKKVVCVGYEGRETDPVEGIKSMRPPRVLFENGNAESIISSVGKHIGEGWIKHV